MIDFRSIKNMKNLNPVIIIISLILSLFVSDVTYCHQSNSFSVAFLVGDVFYSENGSGTWKRAILGEVYPPGYIIKTGKNSEVVLIKGKKRVKIRGNNTVPVTELIVSSKKKEILFFSRLRSRLIKFFSEKKSLIHDYGH